MITSAGIGHTEILKIGIFWEIGNFRGCFVEYLYLYIRNKGILKNLFIYILYKPTPDFPDFPIFPELYFVNKEKAERGINVQCAMCNVQWLLAILYKQH